MASSAFSSDSSYNSANSDPSIRRIIELLIRIFKTNGFSEIRAEVFRLAKFDRADAVEPLWNLLFELIYFVKYGLVDDVCIRALVELTFEERAALVRGELRARGYSTRDLPPPARPPAFSFSNSPQTTDLAGAGSRDLLLALGWLMCREELIARLMFACAHPLLADSMPFRSLQQPDTNALSSSATLDRIALAFELYRLRVDSQEFRNSLEEGTRQTAYLNRKLRYKLRRLESAQQAIVQNSRRLASQSAGVVSIPTGQQELGELGIDRKHLSPLELNLLEHPDRLKEVCLSIQRNCLATLDADSDRLRALLEWRVSEEVFWRWMCSVLDAKLHASTSNPVPPSLLPQPSPRAESAAPECEPEPIDDLYAMKLARERLHDSLRQLEPLAHVIEKELGERKGELNSSMALGEMLADVDEAIAAEESRLSALVQHDCSRVHRLALAATCADGAGVRRELEQLASSSTPTPTPTPQCARPAAAAGAGASDREQQRASSSLMPNRLESLADIRIALRQMESTFSSLLNPNSFS